MPIKTDDATKEAAEETPAKEVKETPAKEAKETPAKEVKETPAKEVKETPAKEVKETPAKEVKESPAKEAKETPAKEVKETPAKEVKESPAKEAKETPAEKKKSSKKAKDGKKTTKAPKKKKEPRDAAEVVVDKKKAEGEKEGAPDIPGEGPHTPPLFGLYDMSDIVMEDPGVKRYINLDLLTVPHVSARYANKKFGKANVSIIERLMNNLMRTKRYTGKKSKTFHVVEMAFGIIHKRTKANPVQVLINAIEHSSPKEEITRLRFGGISVPKAVDISPSRRLDIALRNISTGTIKASHKNKRSMEECLANELIAASKGEMSSFAVSKKEEIERVAASAR